MRYIKIKLVIGLVVLLSVAGLPPASIPTAPGLGDNSVLDLPSPLFDRMQVPQGNKVAFRLYARGIQIYRWNGTSWGFVEPVAMLFIDPNYNVKAGIHYG